MRDGGVANIPFDGEALANGVFGSTKNRDHFHGSTIGYGDEDGEYDHVNHVYGGRFVGEGDEYAGATSSLANRATAGGGGSSKRTAVSKKTSPRTRVAYGRRYESTNTLLDHQGPAPQEYATNYINRSRREHDHNETTLHGILAHVGEGLDNFITGGHVVDLDSGLPGSEDTFTYVDRETPRGQRQTTAVVGSGVYQAPKPLTAAEKEIYEATRAESMRVAKGFEAARAKNGSRFSPGKRRKSFGVYRKHDGAYYAGQPPSFAKSYREFQKLDRERKRQEEEEEKRAREKHEAAVQLNLQRLATVEGRLFLFYRKFAPHMVPKIPELLEKWQGREDTLFYRIRKKYRAPLELPEHWSAMGSRPTSRHASRERPAKSPRARPHTDEERKMIYGTSKRYADRPYRPRANSAKKVARNGNPRIVTRRTGRGEVGVAVPVERPATTGADGRPRSRSRTSRVRRPELTPHELYNNGVEGPLTGGASRTPTKVHLRAPPKSRGRRVIQRPPRRDSHEHIGQARERAQQKRHELLSQGEQVEY